AFAELGINGKNSEFHAAMGLTNLNYIQAIHNKRQLLTNTYNQGLEGFPTVQPVWHADSANNYAYYPLVFESESFMLECMAYLQLNEVFTRRYFYPSLSESLPYVAETDLPVTKDIASRVLCL